MTQDSDPRDESHDPHEDGVGYGRPPKASRFRKGQSGNPRGRPKGSRRGVPYQAALGQTVVVRENGVDRRLTAAEAFLLQLAKKGLRGDGVSTRQALAAIQAARETGAIDTPNEPIVFLTTYEEPGHVGDALECLRMARSLDRYRKTRRYVLETWIVQAALARLGDRRLTPDEQKIVVDAARSPGKVRWPEWWAVRK
jgi:hypothetical protein